MNELNNITVKELRKFGLITGSIFATLFGLFFPWILNLEFPSWPWIVFSVLVSWALVHPRSLKYVYIYWMKFGHALGWLNSRIVLGIMFYVLFLPMAIVLKLLGKDILNIRLDSKIKSYRVNSEKKPKEHIERPF